MSKVNNIFGAVKRKKIKLPKREPDTVNQESYPAFELDDESEYLKILLTNVCGNCFYSSKEDQTGQAVEAHEKMAVSNPGFMAKALPFARQKGYMRLQPTLGLASLAVEECRELSEINAEIRKEKARHDSIQNGLLEKAVGHKGSFVPRQFVISSSLKRKLNIALEERTNYLAKTFDSVILTPNDLMDFMTILKSKLRGEGGKVIKKAVGKWLLRIDEYRAIKYGAAKAGNYSLKDIIKTCHPKGERSEVISYLLGEEYKKRSVPKIAAFERLKKAKTDKQMVKAILDGDLPHEVVTTFISEAGKEVWIALAKKMPPMALLKNLATLDRHGVLNDIRGILEEKFSEESIQRSKILPYRFIEAAKHVSQPWVKTLLDSATDYAFSNIPDIQGTTYIFLDRSGSMGGGVGSYMQIGSIFAISLLKKSEGELWLFDDRLEKFNVNKSKTLMSQVNKIESRGGTNTAITIEKMLRDGIVTDNIILLTDEQQNQGTSFYKTFDRYRRDINPEVKLFIILLAPYQGHLMPKNEKNVFWIHGWSPKVLDFISLASEGFDSMAEAIQLGVL